MGLMPLEFQTESAGVDWHMEKHTRKRELAYPGAEGSSDATDSLPLAHSPWNQVPTLQLSLAGSVAG